MNEILPEVRCQKLFIGEAGLEIKADANNLHALNIVPALTDVTTGTMYKLVVNNGELLLEEL